MFQGSGRFFGEVFPSFLRLFGKSRVVIWVALWAGGSPNGGRAEELVFNGGGTREAILANWEQPRWFYSGTNQTFFEQMGPDVAVPALVSILQDSDWLGSPTYRDHWSKLPDLVRKFVPTPRSYSRAERALSVVGKFGPWASNAVPAIVEQIQQGDDMQKAIGASALVEIGPASAQGAKALGSELSKAGPMAQTGILRVLQVLGPPAHEALPPIRELAAKATNEVRAEAALALWLVARETNAVLAALRPLIIAADPASGNMVMRTLHEMGPAARPLASEVLASLPRWGPQDRPEMVAVVGRVAGTDPTAMALLRSMIGPDSKESPEALRGAVLSLGDIGPEAADAVPALLDLWKRQPELSFDPKKDRQETPVRNLIAAIMGALGKIGPASRSALPQLEQTWRPGGERPKGGRKGLAIHAALAIWQIDQGKTHSAADLIRDWSEWTRQTYERMANRRAGLRQQLERLWIYQSDLLELLRQGDPDHFRHLAELREDLESKW